jgi:hypothetical protein
VTGACRTVVVALAATLVGCVPRGDLMTRASANTSELRPAAGKALVIFLRPEERAGETQAVVYDGTQFIGVVWEFWAVGYQADPGEHRFMVISEAADFMDADLVAGRTYYVEVRPRLGAWRARFSLRPLSATANARDIAGWVADCRLGIANEAGLRWAEANRPSVLEKKAAWEPQWLKKADRPVLRADDGKRAAD